MILTAQEAVKLLPDKEYIHTFRSGGMVLLGTDWRKQDILDVIAAGASCELAGATATGMNHGLCIHSNGPLFVETRQFSESELL